RAVIVPIRGASSNESDGKLDKLSGIQVECWLEGKHVVISKVALPGQGFILPCTIALPPVMNLHVFRIRHIFHLNRDIQVRAQFAGTTDERQGSRLQSDEFVAHSHLRYRIRSQTRIPMNATHLNFCTPISLDRNRNSAHMWGSRSRPGA